MYVRLCVFQCVCVFDTSVICVKTAEAIVSWFVMYRVACVTKKPCGGDAAFSQITSGYRVIISLSLWLLLSRCVGLEREALPSSLTVLRNWNITATCECECKFCRLPPKSDTSVVTYRVRCTCGDGSSDCADFECRPEFFRPTGDIIAPRANSTSTRNRRTGVLFRVGAGNNVRTFTDSISLR